MTRIVALGFAIALVLSVCANATAPTSMTVQGKLTDSSGTPFPAGSKQFVFSIHDAEIGGAKVWPTVSLEYQTLSTNASGLWIANVGSVVPLSDSVFLDTVRWLEVAVDVGGPVVLPRVRLVTGPYAHRVSTVDGASGGTITSKISIGPGHTNSGASAFVAGENNLASGDYGTVSGGTGHSVYGIHGTVGGGLDNAVFGTSSTIGGGSSNQALSQNSTIGGGANNETNGEQSTVAGGRYNKATGLSSTVGGGYENIAIGIDAHIGGGSFDSASGGASTVAGGQGNRATGNFSTIGGGGVNRASGTSSTVAGGYQNVASETDATVGGGYNNLAQGYRSTVGGGSDNLAGGYASTVPGGEDNAAGGDYSFAAGRGARANHEGSFMWHSSPGGGLLTTTAPHQFIIMAEGGTGIGTRAPKSRLHVGDASGSDPTPAPNTLATFSDGDSHAYISVLSPIGSDKGVLFGTSDQPAEGGIVYNTTGMQFRTNGSTTRMLLNTSGRLGVGEQTPEAPLHIKDGSAGAVTAPVEAIATFEKNSYGALTIITPENTGSGIYFGNPINIAHGAISYDALVSDGFAFGVGGAVAQYALTNTGLGLGDLTPDAKLDVVGNVLVTGDVCAANLTCPSDERLKRDIAPIQGALDDVVRLKGVQYHWKDEVAAERQWPSTSQIGLLAQNVQAVTPQAVTQMPDGYLAVDYARLVPLLIEAIKEQQRQIDDLKASLQASRP